MLLPLSIHTMHAIGMSIVFIVVSRLVFICRTFLKINCTMTLKASSLKMIIIITINGNKDIK